MLGSKPGISYQGWMEHAGIYDGSNMALSIWSTPGQGLYSKFQTTTAWGAEFNEVWAMNVWPTSLSEATNAYNTAYSLSVNDPYAWNSDKINSSS